MADGWNMFILYNFIFCIAFIVYFPFLWLKGKIHRDFFMRFGCWPKSLIQEIQAKKNFWVHAVSVGEILAVQGLMAKLQERYPQVQIVLSTVTTTGYALARSKFQNIKIIFAPLDIHGAVATYARRIKPKIYINAETEIWPNLFSVLHKNEVPIVLVNGRISAKSFGGYKILKFFVKHILAFVNIFCMQSDENASRILELGAAREKVRVVGNMKFDDVPQQKIFSPQELGLKGDESLWIAGSTHPGEEEILLDIFKSVTAEFPRLRLVMAPRHVERTPEVISLVRQKGFLAVKFSELNKSALEPRGVIVVDTMGHLRSLYSLAEIVFVGKSLVGQGGQNIIEPAFFAKPIIVGPHMQNFEDITELFKKANAILQVRGAEELKSQLIKLLQDPKRRKAMGETARAVIQKNQGATERTLDSISEFLKV